MIITEQKASPRTKQWWIELGADFLDAKERGATAKAFAERLGINYGTMTSNFSKLKSEITAERRLRTLKGKSPKGMSKSDKQLVLINSFRKGLRDKIRNEGAATNNKSQKWFNDTVKKTIKGHKVTKPVPGKLYTFVYDAKHKATLPYWDKFPLIIYLGDGVSSKAGTQLMYGLNLHYIPPKARQQLLEDLLKRYANTSTISNKTKLQVNWSKVKGFRGSSEMIKSYLPSHIKGTLVEIKPSDWINVIFLPLQQFMSKGKRYSANKVWSKY